MKIVKVDWLNRITAYYYDAAGRMYRADHFNGTKTTYTHDKANRLKAVTHTANDQTLTDYQYTLDGNGNRIKALVEAPQLPEKLINHDQNYNYNASKNRLNNAGTDSFTYDNEGQLKTKNGTAFSFDYAHRLISYGNNQYVYDGVGNRIKATRNGQITKYIYDAAGNLLAEANAGNQITRYYIYGHGLIGFVDAQTGQLYTYHFDGTGHTVAITGQSQQTVNTYAYDPYGRIMGESESIPQPFKYVGQLGVFAEADGLYYMRARYYDAQMGRFISEDPIGFAGGLNLYAYVGGNPIGSADPLGLVDLRNLGFGVTDFVFSTGEAVGGLGLAIGSTAGGPLAPAGYYAGISAAFHGAAGMANSGLAIQNALFETNGPGLLEGVGGAVFGDSGSKAGAAADLFLGIRPAAIASGGLNKLRDVYDLANGVNTTNNAFSNRKNSSNK